MHSKLCDWLKNVSVVGCIEFLPMMQFIFAHNMLMHCHATFVLFSFLCLIFCCGSSFSFSLSMFPIYGTQKVYSFQEPDLTSWFFFFFFFFFSLSSWFHKVPWWVGQSKLLWELLWSGDSFRTLNFLDTPLPLVFSSWGWVSLCEIPKRCPSMFIQKFYSNMHTIDTSVPKCGNASTHLNCGPAPPLFSV